MEQDHDQDVQWIFDVYDAVHEGKSLYVYFFNLASLTSFLDEQFGPAAHVRNIVEQPDRQAGLSVNIICLSS